MKILVTGAAGFIGFHLVKKLIEKGHTVVGLDNINSYYDINLKYGRLKECGISHLEITEDHQVLSVTHPNYTFQKSDITNLVILEELFAREGFDRVFHMAAQPGVRYSLENPHAYIQSNVVGFLNLLECCRKFNIKHLVYASSSSIYGMNDKVPFSEEDQVDFPVSMYAATKKSNELMAHTYSHLYKLPTTGLRFFTVYGPWGRPDMSPMLFASAIYTGKPIKVFNGGDMQRDFTYVDDIVTGIVKVANTVPKEEADRPYYRIFNIGNSRPVPLMTFINAMESVIGIPAKLDMYPMQPGDVKTTYADTSKLQRFADYQPRTDISEGVKLFAEWYKSYFSIK